MSNIPLIVFLSTVSFAAGFYFLLADILHLPTLATTRAALNLSRHRNFQTKKLDAIVLELSTKLAGLIHLDEYRSKKLTATLKSADISLPPETWLAQCYLKSASILLCVIPTLVIFPIMTPVIVMLAVRQLFTELKSAEMIAKKKKDEIENDLPRFTATVAQETRNTHNILAILEGYLDSAMPAFRSELEITIAGMKSGSHEKALMRLESRVGSPMLSQVIRGMLAVMRGDDGIMYFNLLVHDFDQDELQKLKLKAAKIPPKVNVCTGAVFACFMILIFIILGMQIYQSYSALNM